MVGYGDIPQVNRGAESELRKLFVSERSIALLVNKTVQEGYGFLDIGTVMATPCDGSGNAVSGELTPYPKVAYSGEDMSEPGWEAYMPLIVDGSASALIYVSNDDSYKVRVGQHLGLTYYNSGYQYVDLGKVTAIDQDSGVNGRAKITTTNAPTTNATIARQAAAYVKSDSSSPYAAASHILDKAVDTGTGENAAGALTSTVISNAILWYYSCKNIDSAALTDLGNATQDGPHLILK